MIMIIKKKPTHTDTCDTPHLRAPKEPSLILSWRLWLQYSCIFKKLLKKEKGSSVKVRNKQTKIQHSSDR